MILNLSRIYLAYLFSILLSGLAVGIYTTNSPEACHYVAENCEANIIVAENKHQLHKILKVSSALSCLITATWFNKKYFIAGQGQICANSGLNHQVITILTNLIYLKKSHLMISRMLPLAAYHSKELKP